MPNILIAEDDKINMMLIRTLLRTIMPQAVINEVNDGIKAVSAYSELNPDLIFMDVYMPLMRGYEATQQIRETNTKIPIIALTSATNVEERQLCFDAGMSDYITKPVLKSKLEEILKKWL